MDEKYPFIDPHKALETCESPIEKDLLFELCGDTGAQIPVVECVSYDDMIQVRTHNRCDPALAATQVKVGSYRADIMLAMRHSWRLEYVALECDGRKYHGTPAQIERDRIRDVYFAKQDIRVIRIAGSAIIRNPALAAHEIMRRVGLRTEQHPDAVWQTLGEASYRGAATIHFYGRQVRRVNQMAAAGDA